MDRVINDIFTPTLPDIAEKTFDAICLNDVLEHVVSPEQILRELKPFLSPNGVVVASIPNILFFYQIMKILVEEDWKYEKSGIMDNTHLRFFTKKSIVRMFGSCGYEITKLEGINPSFGLKYTLANVATFGRLTDWKYVQFAIQAKPDRNEC
jgi:2-polyprenyl-3-methyl-5-hydroxy-6-metoxy-1,4-benzoquinol methylase